MPPVNGAILQKEFDRIDKDQSGTLDRDEVKKLLNNLDPRTGITNEELDNFMEEVDASGDDQIDFQEFKEYWEKNLDADGYVPQSRGQDCPCLWTSSTSWLTFVLGQVGVS
eukprot:SAG31_NODE_486_length_15001_cov_8.454405_11_plen_111_part_00